MRDILAYSKICISCLLVIILMTGCVSMSPPEVVMPHYYKPWTQRQTELMNLSQWTIYGAFSIQYAGQTQLANYTWQQQDSKNYTLTVSGPLSIGAARIVGQSGTISLTKADGTNYTAKTPEELMHANLGWQLPLHNLYYWVRGVPAPHANADIKIDKKNYLLSLRQQGWLINYLQFETVKGVELPVMLTLENRQLRAKVVIKNWKLGVDD